VLGAKGEAVFLGEESSGLPGQHGGPQGAALAPSHDEDKGAQQQHDANGGEDLVNHGHAAIPPS